MATFNEMYNFHTNAVLEQILEWQSRPLDDLYPIVYLDCIVLKIRQDKRVINKSIYLALGINLEGHKELLGLWLAETEGGQPEMKSRGRQSYELIVK